MIHFHGTRQSGKKDDLTMEKASTAARFLREYNDIRAIELAESIIKRTIFIYLNIRESFAAIREKAGKSELADVDCFARALFDKLSPVAESLPRKALHRYSEMQELSNYVLRTLNKFDLKSTPQAQVQRAILRAVIEYEYRACKKDPSWTFTDDNLDRIVEDFRLIQDFYTGEHYGVMIPIVRMFGQYFLNQEDSAIYKTKEFANDKDRQDWLFPKAVIQFQPLWYFVVSICRLLQEKENPLTALDAYWLGIVHKVLGTGLPCIRQIIENPPPETTPSATPVVPPSVSAQQP